MSIYKFEKITREHPVFQSDDYKRDVLLFNYIEGAKRFDDNNLYSDGEKAVICWKHNHPSVWIWIALDAMDDVDLLIAISDLIISLNIDQPEIFIRSEVSDKFSDIFALATKQLDYQPNDSFSLGAYYHNEQVEIPEDANVEKIDPEEQYELIKKFYSNLKDEFRWDDKKAEHFIKEYSIMEGYVLKVNNEPVSVAIIDAGEGKVPDIRSLATLEEHRNNGYATTLTSFLSKSLNGNVMVYSNRGNKAAARVWKKSGFISIGEITLILNK